MKLFGASQRSVVHIEAVLTSNQSPVWPAKIFQRLIDTVVCNRCLSQSFRHQSTSCAKHHIKAVLCLDISIVSSQTRFDWKQKQNFSLLIWDRSLKFMLQHPTMWHIVGCCNINFSDLSQIRREKFCFCKQCLYFFVVLFCTTAVVSLQRLANFSPCHPLIFCFSPTRYAHSLLKNEFFLNIHGWILREEQRKRNFQANEVSKRRSKKLFFTLFCALNQTFFCSSR